MDDRKKHSVSAEELGYARKMGVVMLEDRLITLDQALDVLERCFEAVSQEEAAQAFLCAFVRAMWITAAIFWRPMCMRAVGFLLTEADTGASGEADGHLL